MGAKAGKRKAGGKPGGKSKPAGRQRLALIVFGAILAVLFLGFAVAQGIGSPSVPAGDAAKVEDVPDAIATISEDQLDTAVGQQVAQQIAQKKLKKAPAPGTTKFEEIKFAALGELLDQTWIEGEAEELGITVTDKQIEQELASIKKQSFPTEAAFQKFLKESHFSEQDVNDRVKLQILTKQIQERITNETPPPSKSEIAAYFEAEKATQFTTKESRDVRLIVNEDKKKVEEAKAELEKDHSPAAWKKVAPKFSSDPTSKAKGGLQEGITEELLQGEVKTAIFGSATGELVGPVKFEKNYLLVEVAKLNPAKVQTLAEASSQISQTLTQEKQQEFFSEFVTDYQNKWQSRTYCASSVSDGINSAKVIDELSKRCVNVTSSGRPANAPEACYEADPKTPATECPAPVTPVSPALPGSVTVQKPKGEPFPQLPHPEGSGAAAEAPPGVPTEAPAEAPPTGE